MSGLPVRDDAAIHKSPRMDDDTRIRELLEEALNSDQTLEELSRDTPELLPALRERWDRLRNLDEQIDALFPATVPLSPPGEAAQVAEERLPQIDGYRVEGVLGRGGVGVVYAATHIGLKRRVAIKMLLAGDFASAPDKARLRREAEAIAALRHENIVQIFDFGEHEQRPYFTMEFVEGGDLTKALDRAPLPARRAATLVATLARAVATAHQSGIVHRDIKPGNVLLTREGTPKITDFGLARRLDSDPLMTVTGARVGTPSYMAPEQAAGAKEALCPPVDIYALGAMLYELLVGRPPFRAESTAETQRQVITLEPVPPTRLNPRVPRDLETICLKCLRKTPAQRYASALALAEDLDRFMRGDPITARRVSQLERAARWARRRPAGAALIVTGAALLVLAVVAISREITLETQQKRELSKWAARLEYLTGLQRDGKFAEARAILGRVPDGGSPLLQRQIAQAQRELDFVERLDAIRMERADAQRRDFGTETADREYDAEFRKAGFGEIGDPPEQVAARIAQSNMRAALIAALDDWAYRARERERLEWVLRTARLADPDPAWRDLMRNPVTWFDQPRLRELAASADVRTEPVPLMLVLGSLLNDQAAAAEFLRRVQRARPADFWANFLLGDALQSSNPEDAIGYYRAALALRPQAVAPRVNIGVVLTDLGRANEAVEFWEEAITLQPDAPMAHLNLAVANLRWGDFAKVVTHADLTLRGDPDSVLALAVRAQALIQLGRVAEAKSDLARAMSLLSADDPMRERVIQSMTELSGDAASEPSPR